MKILLHTCCAPCLIYPLGELKSKGFEVAGFFYNPNIYPLNEYALRRQALEDLNKTAGMQILYPEYQPSEFEEVIKSKEDSPERCSLCWSLRLLRTARAAKDNGFDCFSTTLLVSPHQDQQLLKTIGSEISEKEGVDFYYQDFRCGYRQAHNQAKAQGLYCQKYCGCVYSRNEPAKKTKAKE